MSKEEKAEWDDFSEVQMRKVLFTVCETEEQLHAWIKFFLGFDLPDCIVDVDSNSSPMALIWEVYNAARTNSLALSRILAFAARDSMKTLAAAILEVLFLVHLDRAGGHLAAIEPQATVAQNYVKMFFALPYLRDFITSQNQRTIEFEHFCHSTTGEHLTFKEYSGLVEDTKREYKHYKRILQILIATMSGTNSYHCGFMCVDEIDVIQNPKAYEEAKAIPARFDGKEPITLLISTRKTGVGLVQAEIEKAEAQVLKPKMGSIPLQVRHWNLLDVTEACPPERHLPNEPKVDLYYSDENLDHVLKEEYDLKDFESQKKYVKAEGYAGCAKCPLFSVCKTRLATEQKSKSPMLKSIHFTIQKFGETSLEFAIAQLMCRKPPSTGLVYPALNRNLHMLSPRQMAEKITGEERFEDTFSKADLVNLMMSRGMEFFAGLDWGYVHEFVVISGAKQGMNMFIFDVIAVTGLDPEQKLTVAEKVKLWNPRIFADPEAPDQIKLFKKKGFNCSDWSKAAGSVSMGIDVFRTKLRPAIGPPTVFLLAGDPQCEYAFTALSKYHFAFDAAGEPTGTPDEKGDDIPDAARYLVMNVFAPRGKITAPEDGPSIVMGADHQRLPTQDNYLSHFINQHLGSSANPLESTGEAADPGKRKGKKGKIYFDFG